MFRVDYLREKKQTLHVRCGGEYYGEVRILAWRVSGTCDQTWYPSGMTERKPYPTDVSDEEWGFTGRSIADADAVIQKVVDAAAVRRLLEQTRDIRPEDAELALAIVLPA